MTSEREMVENIRNIKSEKSDLRKFGIMVGTIAVIIGGYLFWKEKESFQIFLAIGITFFLIAIAIPAILKPAYWVWMIFSTILGWIMTRIILCFLYYIAFTIIGITSQLIGKKFIKLRWDKSKKSYWNFRNNDNLINKNHEKQF